MFNDKEDILINFEKKSNEIDNDLKNVKIAIEKVSEACRIFDKYGLYPVSNVLLDLLANLK